MASRSFLELIIRATGGEKAAREFKKAEGGMAKMGVAAKALGPIVGGLTFLAAARGAVRLADDMTQASKELQDARNALEATTGSAQAASEAIAVASKETLGLASRAEVAASANLLLATNLAKDAEEAGKLTRAGSVLVGMFEAQGASLEKFNRLLSTGNRVLLDNFGLTQDLVNQRKALIVASGQATGEEAKLLAVRQLLLESADKYSDSMSDATRASLELKAATTDLKAAIGEELTPAVGQAQFTIAGFFRTIADRATLVREQRQSILENAKSWHQYQKMMKEAGIAIDGMNKKLFLQIKNQQGWTAEVEAADRVLSLFVSTHVESTKVSALHTTQLHAERYAYEMLKGEMMEAEAIRASMRPREDTPWYDQAGGQWAIGQQGMVGGGLLSQAEADAQAHNQKLTDAAEEAADAFKTSFTNAADDLKTLIENEIQPTLSEVWSPSGEEQRMDEDARRLATLVTEGFNSEWLNQLNTKYAGMSFWEPITAAMESGDEGALRAAAESLLTGPEVSMLWDTELIKERVRQKIIQDNARQQIIDMVMQELSGEGIEVGGENSNGSMQIGGTALAVPVAAGLSAGIPEAMAEQPIGENVMNNINGQLASYQKGHEAMAMIVATGFTEYLPSAMGVSAHTFLETLVKHVASAIGVPMERG